MTIYDQATALLAEARCPFGWIMGDRTWRELEKEYASNGVPMTATEIRTRQQAPRGYMGLPVRLFEGTGLILEHRL